MKQRSFTKPALLATVGIVSGGMLAIWLRQRLTPSPPPAQDSVVATITATLSDAPPTTPVAAAMQTALAQNAAEEDVANTATATATKTETGLVGNRKTLIYHQPTSPNLPAEDNRQYFASEADAHHAGYRRAENE